jgi:hypothetical protein
VARWRRRRTQVNYKYELERVHGNNREYVVDGAVVASPQVTALLGHQPGAGV